MGPRARATLLLWTKKTIQSTFTLVLSGQDFVAIACMKKWTTAPVIEKSLRHRPGKRRKCKGRQLIGVVFNFIENLHSFQMIDIIIQ